MTKVKSSNSHVLLTLGTLFTLSNAGKFLPDDIAIAQEQITPTITANIEKESAENDVEPDANPIDTRVRNLSMAMPAESDQKCFTGAMAAALADDYWLFETEKEQLRDDQFDLRARENQLEARMGELEALHGLLEERWSLMQTTANEDVKHLSEMYESMKPDQAALIFDQMDPLFAAGFLRQISSEQAGLILANMDAGKAYEVSLSLSNLNTDIRNDELQH